MIQKKLILDEISKNPNISSRELGEIFGKTKRQMLWILETYSIKRDRKVIQKHNNGIRGIDFSMSPILLELIIGSLLGDGCMRKYNTTCSKTAKNSKLVMGHSAKQFEYVVFKKGLFENAGCKCNLSKVRQIESMIDGRKIISNEIRLTTSHNKQFNAIRDVWYSNSLKIIPKTLILTPLILAIWFMDDGSKHFSSYYLHTQGFALEDQLFLIEILKRDLDIDAALHSTSRKNRTTGEISHNIYIKSNSKKLFTNLIKKYICNTMQYKLHNGSV